MTATSPWGNPAHRTFTRTKTKLVAVDDLRVRVHKDLVPIVERLLTDLTLANLKVGTLTGHPASLDGTGLVLTLDPPAPDLVAKAMEGYGYVPVPRKADQYRWGRSYDDAVALSAQIDGEQPPGAVKDAPASLAGAVGPTDPADAAQGHTAVTVTADREHPDWDDGLIGARDLRTDGDHVGRDVLFLQAYLDTPRTGVYDPATVAAVAYFKQRRGLAADGDMTREGWQQFLPRLRGSLHPGDVGRAVRILSAAMVAAGHTPLTDPVSARFNMKLQREVREMQEALGLRRTGRVTSIEWNQLLVYPWGTP